jgi:hypothetical protein
LTFNQILTSDQSGNFDNSSLFLQYIEKYLLEEITFQSNLYYSQKNNTNYSDAVLSKENIYYYIMIQIIMGVKKLPNYKNYWSSNPIFKDRIVSGIMSLKTYEFVGKYLHFNNNILTVAIKYDLETAEFLDNKRDEILDYEVIMATEIDSFYNQKKMKII